MRRWFLHGGRSDNYRPGLAMDDDGRIYKVSADGTEEEVPGTGGGSQPGVARVLGPFPFAFDDPDLHEGIEFYTPTVDDLLLGLCIRVTTLWDGTHPRADVGQFTGGETEGLIDVTGVNVGGEPLDEPLIFNSGVLTIGPGLGEYGNMYVFTTDDPLKIVVSQDGEVGDTPATTLAPDAVSLPLTVTSGVNDEFLIWYIDSSTETFTVAPGTYTTIGQVLAAMGAAIGSVSAAAFSAQVTPTNGGTNHILLTNVGGGGNNKSIDLGGDDVAADLGFPAFQTMTGGLGGSPGATQGEATIYLWVATPSLT